jgi:hypothetical protein
MPHALRMRPTILAAVVALGAVAMPNMAAPAAQAPYRLVEGWGKLPAGMEYGEVPGMTIDKNGKIFAFHRNSPPVDRKGVFIGSARDESIKYKFDQALAEGVAVDAQGNIYVGETVPGKTVSGRDTGHIVRKLARN